MIKVAIMYDFDKTLSSKDMQEYEFIPSLGYEKASDFWNEVGILARNNKMDSILAYMFLMLKKANDKDKPIRKSDFESLGKRVEYLPGVITWFERINEIGKSLGLDIEHYIISSGLTEIIEGTCISHHFKKVYACKYYYDSNNVAKWPALVVNYTTKTQYIFRINKQILDENEDKALNEYVDDALRPIAFNRMIYIGDGITDIPCMKLVHDRGGKSIVVYHRHNEAMKKIASDIVNDKRANYMVEANYEQGSVLEEIMTLVLEEIKVKSALEHYEGVV